MLSRCTTTRKETNKHKKEDLIPVVACTQYLQVYPVLLCIGGAPGNKTKDCDLGLNIKRNKKVLSHTTAPQQIKQRIVIWGLKQNKTKKILS